MTDYAAVFSSASPKPVDFTQTEYDANVGEIEMAARAAGYRQSGVRLGFVVFTSKPPKK